MDEYAYQEKGIEDMLKRERQKQENKLQDMLEKRKRDKLANLESDKWNKIDDTQNQIKNKLKNLSEQERALEGLKLKELDPALQEIVRKAEERIKGGLQWQKSEQATVGEIDKLRA